MLTGEIRPAKKLYGGLMQPVIEVEVGDSRMHGSCSLQLSTEEQPTVLRQTQGITFDGTKYIDLGYRAGNTTKIEIIFRQTEYGKFLFGARAGANSDDAFAFCSYQTSMYTQFGSFQAVVNAAITLNDTHTLVLSQGGAVIDGVTVKTFDTMSFSSEVDLYLGTRNQSGVVDTRIFKGTVYSVKLFENNILTAWLVPHASGIEGETGLFDVINRVFYRI